MAELAETRPEHVFLPMEATRQSGKEIYQRKRILMGVVVAGILLLVVAGILLLVLVCRLMLHNPGTRNGLNQVQPSTASWNDPSSTPSQTTAETTETSEG